MGNTTQTQQRGLKGTSARGLGISGNPNHYLNVQEHIEAQNTHHLFKKLCKQLLLRLNTYILKLGFKNYKAPYVFFFVTWFHF